MIYKNIIVNFYNNNYTFYFKNKVNPKSKIFVISLESNLTITRLSDYGQKGLRLV